MPQDFSEGTPPTTLHFRFPPPAVGGAQKTGWEALDKWVGGGAARRRCRGSRPLRQDRLGSARQVGRRAARAAQHAAASGPSGKTGWEALDKWVAGGAARPARRGSRALRQDRLGSARQVGRRRGRRGSGSTRGLRALRQDRLGSARQVGRRRRRRGSGSTRPPGPPARPVGKRSTSGSAAAARAAAAPAASRALRQDRLGSARQVGRRRRRAAAAPAASGPLRQDRLGSARQVGRRRRRRGAAAPRPRGPSGKTGWEALDKWVGGGGGAAAAAPAASGPSGKTGWEALDKWVGGGGGAAAAAPRPPGPPARPVGKRSTSGSRAGPRRSVYGRRRERGPGGACGVAPRRPEARPPAAAASGNP